MTPKQCRHVCEALLAYWTAREEARRAQEGRGLRDQGSRGDVTSGGHLDRVAQLLANECLLAGAPAHLVCYKAPQSDPNWSSSMQQGYTLPGFYRPTKEWDLVVWANGAPIIAIELKSQNGPSYGSNANNRAEEAIGAAIDLDMAVKAGLIPARPWLGYVFVIEDDEASRKRRGRSEASFLPKDPVFADWSYQSRVRDLCRRLVSDRHGAVYDGAWPVTTSRPWVRVEQQADPPPDTLPGLEPAHGGFSWRELDPSTLGYSKFVRGMVGRIKSHYGRRSTERQDSGPSRLF